MAKDLAVEGMGMKKWLAQFFVFSFWPALTITVLLVVLKIFGVPFLATRWWDILFIPLIATATIMTWKKLDGSDKVGPAILSFVCSLFIVALSLDGKIMLNRPLGFYDIITFSAIPSLVAVLVVFYYAIKNKLTTKNFDNVFLGWICVITWSVFSGYMFFYSIASGFWNIDWLAMIALAILALFFSMGLAVITVLIVFCVYGIIAVHRIAFPKKLQNIF